MEANKVDLFMLSKSSMFPNTQLPLLREMLIKASDEDWIRINAASFKNPKHDFAMLEMKQKQGANQKKRSLRMTKADAEALIAGKYEVLLKYKEDFALKMQFFAHFYW